MRRRIPLLMMFLAALAATPTASARTCLSEDALGGSDVCDALNDYELDRLFGDYADVVVALIGLLLVVAVLVMLVAILRRPLEGPRLGSKPREPVLEVAPGDTAQLTLDVENKRKNTSVDVDVRVDEVPLGWTAVNYAAISFPSGFTAPQALPPGDHFHLSSRNKGHHEGAVAVSLTAPPEAVAEETHDVVVRLLPHTGHTLRKHRGRKHRFTVLVAPPRASLQITDVSHQPSRIVPGTPVLTRATVSNVGKAPASGVPVLFLLNDQPLEEKTVDALGIAEQSTVEFHWTPVVGENRIRIHLA